MTSYDEPMTDRRYPRSFILVGILGLSLIFAVSRFFQPARPLQVEDVYKDMAHLWVGGLFLATGALYLQARGVAGIAAFVREKQAHREQGGLSDEQTDEVFSRLNDWRFVGAWKWVAGAALALTAVEVAAFLIGMM